MSFDKELGQNHLNKGEIRTAFGREPAHSPWGIYDSYKGALEGKPLVSKWTASLDGVWKFRHYDRADTVDKFWSEDYSHDDWDNIRVPGNWELQGFGQPVYTNTLYPWKYERDGSHIVNPLDDDSKYGIPNPPKIPEENPAGCYYREFSISDDWADKDVFIYFKGVETVFYCWLNGQAVGYSNDSKLPCEFDISPYLRKGVNTLKVKVLRYADASYLEDQDYWHLCGIYRSVFLYARPKKRLVDWKIEATPDASLSYGSLKADVKINRFDGYGGYRIRLDLYDPDGGLAGTRVGDVNISAEYRQYEKPTSATARIEMDIDNVSLWTPETPHLYRAVMTLLSPTGDQVDFESCKVGFRNIEIKNGIILLNGSRLIIRGVNRHDHDAVTGRTISKEQMIDEIKCMKGLGINSVRTSHYPNDPMWYDLCDEWGLLLVCESNLETHGVFGELTHDPAWGSAFLDRLIRMAVTFKNHASIYSWSLGNESGVGANHAGMAGWIREYDPTRLCQYESGDPDKSISDIRGAMYANQSHIMSMLTDIHDDRPIVLIEYLYNIRNSGGGMNKFLDLSEKYPRFQGGYIWDWKDKSLLKTRADGKNSYAYGGDFGEDIVEWRDPKFMTNNGIVMPDLSLKPVALEVKQVYCPLIIEEILSDNQWDLDEPPGNYIVKNRNHVLDSSHYKIVYKILEDGKEIKTGIFDLALIKPGEDLKVKFNQPFSKRVNSEYYIEFSVRYAYSTPYSKADDEVGVFQFLLGAGELSPLEMSDQVSAAGLCPTNILDWPKATQASLSLDKSSSGFVIAGTGFKVDLDKQSGRLTLICGQERV
ncbi:MAG TPA: glycoside hydrolase family 2 TIM barrel-domain containing protein, partial [Bacillota bacterium]|nr:glycoside hydrolase family 2 TIM barrel-domain containing protein [Bacillota bacterium]